MYHFIYVFLTFICFRNVLYTQKRDIKQIHSEMDTQKATLEVITITSGKMPCEPSCLDRSFSSFNVGGKPGLLTLTPTFPTVKGRLLSVLLFLPYNALREVLAFGQNNALQHVTPAWE